MYGSGLLTRLSIRGVLYRMLWAVKFDHEVDIKKLVDFLILCSDVAEKYGPVGLIQVLKFSLFFEYTFTDSIVCGLI